MALPQQWPSLQLASRLRCFQRIRHLRAFSRRMGKRDLIVNFKGNSELTTEIDHQQAVDKAIDLVSSFLKAVFSEKREPQTHSLPFHNSLWSAYQPQPESILNADSASSANRYVRQQVCRMPTTHSVSRLQR